MNCSIFLDSIECSYDAKISKCQHYFCELCAINLVSRNCLLCNNTMIACVDGANIYSHFERFINSDDYSIRLYNLDSKDQNYSYPSVTSVTALLGYVGFKIHRNKMLQTCTQAEYDKNSKIITDRGTLVHLVIERFLKDPINYNIFSEGHVAGTIVRSMMPFLKNIRSIKLQEYVLISHQNKIAGQVDCVAFYNGKLSIIDFKTSVKRKTKSLVASYFHQCAAYAACFEETFEKPIEQLVLIIGIINEDASQIMIEPYTKDSADSFKKLRDQFSNIFKI